MKNWLVNAYNEIGVDYALLIVALIITIVVLRFVYSSVLKLESKVQQKWITFTVAALVTLIFIGFFDTKLNRSIMFMFATFGIFEYFGKALEYYLPKWYGIIYAKIKDKVTKE
jgi:hypothetical protein